MRLYFAYICIKLCQVSKKKCRRFVSGVHRDVGEEGSCFTSSMGITDPSACKTKWRSRLGFSLYTSNPSSVNALAISTSWKRDSSGFVWCPPSGTFLHHFWVKFISSHLPATVFFQTQPVSIYLVFLPSVETSIIWGESSMTGSTPIRQLLMQKTNSSFFSPKCGIYGGCPFSKCHSHCCQ